MFLSGPDFMRSTETQRHREDTGGPVLHILLCPCLSVLTIDHVLWGGAGALERNVERRKDRLPRPEDGRTID